MSRSPSNGLAITFVMSFVVLGPFLLMGWGDRPARLSKSQISEKTELFSTGAKELATAGFAHGVDDCGGLRLEYGTSYPVTLTTPIAYSESIPLDPFAHPPRPLRVLVDHSLGNGTPMAVVSVGPDSVSGLDTAGLMMDMTSRTMYINYLAPYPQVAEVQKGDRWTSLTEHTLRYEVEFNRVRFVDGRELDLPRNRVPGIPGLDTRTAGSGRAVHESLINHGLVIYDPTNGTISTGDVVAVYANFTRYDPTTASSSMTAKVLTAQ